MCFDGASLEENTVHNLYGCWKDFYMWGWSAFDLTDSSWWPTGAPISIFGRIIETQPCNTALPFAKVLNSIFLLTYALSDNYDLQWHAQEDYRSSARAGNNRFHGPFFQRFIEYQGSFNATTISGRTDLHCPLFNVGSVNDSPSGRAGVQMHESWHHWQDKHGFVGKHPQCGSPAYDCDYYYFHTVSRYDFGQLHNYDTDRRNFAFHSPRQVQVEFLADLAELSQPWVPTIVSHTARALGNHRLDYEFVNAVAYRIGNPRPF